MIHLKIISAVLPPKYKTTNPFVKVIALNKDKPVNPVPIACTKRQKKTSNPEWNETIYIPFYCYDYYELEFCNKKLIGDEFIGKAQILINEETFSQTQPQTAAIEIRNNDFKSYCTYEISPFMSSITIGPPPYYETLKAFIYLTYDPPLQDGETVKMHTISTSSNATLFEEEYTDKNHLIKRGPSGITDVLFKDKYFAYDQLCFYAESINYTGKVSLNIANSPYPAATADMKQYFLFYEPISVEVRSQKDVNYCYSLFPYVFVLSKSNQEFKKFNFEENLGPHIIPINQGEIKNDKSTEDSFLEAIENERNNPQASAIKQIFQALIRNSTITGLLTHIRYNVELNKKYSLRRAYEYHQINSIQYHIVFSIHFPQYDYYYDCFAFKYSENTQSFDLLEESSGFANKAFKDTDPGYYMDRRRLSFYLEYIPPDVKYIALISTAQRPPGFSYGACRVIDQATKKELMYFGFSPKGKSTSALLAMLVRNEDDWYYCPLLQYFTGQSHENAFEYLNSTVLEQIRAK